METTVKIEPANWTKIIEAISTLDDVEALRIIGNKALRRRKDLLELEASRVWFSWIKRL
jgi:hypothetical protein